MKYLRVYDTYQEYLDDATTGGKYYVNGARKIHVASVGNFLCDFNGYYCAAENKHTTETIDYSGNEWVATLAPLYYETSYPHPEGETNYMVKYTQEVKDVLDQDYPDLAPTDYLMEFCSDEDLYAVLAFYSFGWRLRGFAFISDTDYVIDQLNELIMPYDMQTGYYGCRWWDNDYKRFKGMKFTTDGVILDAKQYNEPIKVLEFTAENGEVLYGKYERVYNEGDEVILDGRYMMLSGATMDNLSNVGWLYYLEISRKYDEFISNYVPGAAVIKEDESTYVNRILPETWNVRATYDVQDATNPIIIGSTIGAITEKAVVDDSVTIWDATPEFHYELPEDVVPMLDNTMGKEYLFDSEGEHTVDFLINSKSVVKDAFCGGWDPSAQVSNLVRLDLGEGITEVDDWALNVGSSLTAVSFPASFKQVKPGTNAQFQWCTNLQRVDYNGTPMQWATKINFASLRDNPLHKRNWQHAEDYGVRMYINGNELTDLTITGAKAITPHCFDGCISITSLTVEEGVEQLNDAFNNCSMLKEATLPSTIGQGSWFNACLSLETVNLSEGLTEIPVSAFCQCRSLTGITIPESVKTIHTNAFTGAFAEGAEISLENVETVDAYAFNGADLSSVEFSENLQTIGDFAFAGTNLTGVTVPGSVGGNLGASCFAKCYFLEDIILEEGITRIPAYAFGYIPSASYEGPKSYYHVSIPSTIEVAADAIDGKAFYPYTGGTSYSQPTFYMTGLTFDANDWLNQFTFNNSSTGGTIAGKIPMNNVTEITFGPHMTNIPDYSFSGFTKINKVHCLGTVPPRVNTPSNVCGLKLASTGTLYVPAGCTAVYSSSGFKTALGGNWTIEEE